MNKEIFLSDKKYFNIFIGKRILKSKVFDSKGNIPVYSANVFSPFGFLDKSNIKDFSYDYILWGIDGNFNFNIIKKGRVFANTDHCGVIKILDKDIIPEYLLYQLILKSHILGYDRTLRPSLQVMEKVSVEIPVDKHGEFDTLKQNEISERHKKINEIKRNINERSQDIINSSIEIKLPKSAKEMMVEEIFDFPETNSGITKEFCEQNRGNIPVYGCSYSEDSVLGYIKDKINGVKYYSDSLTWNRNGSVGKVFFRRGNFSTNEDHRVLQLKKEFENNIDLFYIRFVLENAIKERGFSFTNKLGKSKIKDIEITIPLDKNRVISLTEQISLREKYEKIKLMKEKLSQEVYSLNEVIVEI